MPNPAMERRPRPIDRHTNKPMRHRIGVQAVHVLPVVSFIPNEALPETMLPHCLAVRRRVMRSKQNAAEHGLTTVETFKDIHIH